VRGFFETCFNKECRKGRYFHQFFCTSLVFSDKVPRRPLAFCNMYVNLLEAISKSEGFLVSKKKDGKESLSSL